MKFIVRDGAVRAAVMLNLRTLAVAFSLFAGAGATHAATLVWTNGDNFWQTTTAWTTNTGSTGNLPGPADNAWFTNNIVYTVTLNADATVKELIFTNAANSTATVTLDLGTNSLTLLETSTSSPTLPLEVADAGSSTSIVYIAASAVAGKGLFATNSAGTGRILVGRNGIGRLFVTNGFVAAIQTAMGGGGSGRGSIVLSGPNTYCTNKSFFLIGNNTGSKLNSLVISNSASLTVATTFAVGGPAGGGANTNSLLLDTGGRLFTGTGGTITIGSGTGVGNTATVQGGAVWNNGNGVLTIGGTGSGNSLTIGTNSEVINISTLIVSAGNSLNLQGGLLQASVVVSNFGTIQGFGTIAGDTVIAGGSLLSLSNSLGPLVFSNNLTIVSNATTTVQLGTNFNTTVVTSNLTLDGTLNLTDSGGFTNGTYTLFTYGGTLTTNGTPTILTIGTTPNAGFIYAIDISTPGEVNLNVQPPPPTAAFSGSPTTGEAPLAVTFTDTSTGNITNRFWDFGDGNTSNTTATSVGHIYNSAGTNDVTLIVSGPGGSDTNTQLAYIIVTNPAPPVADFSGSPTSGEAPLAVTFTDTSTGNITNRFWDFGDGNTSNTTATSVDYTYNSAGTNDVSLTVLGLGGSSSTNRTAYISVTVPDTTPPNLQIDSPTDFEVFTNADITVAGVADDATGLANVKVNGAAASLVETNWSKSVTLSSGTNTITVIATDGSASLNTATQIVHAVFDPPVIPTNHPPQIMAPLSVTNALLQIGTTAVVVANETNTFAVSATDPDNDPLDYQWTFGDGDTTNTAVGIVEHIYTNDCGPLNASVTVSDGQASTNSDLTVAVACQMQITKLQAKPNFKKPNTDKFNLTATVQLLGGFNPSGKSVSVDVAGAQATFTLSAKGKATNAQGSCKLSFNKKTSDWTLKVSQKNGDWQTPWAAAGLVNADVPKPGSAVSLTVVVLVEDEGFAGDQPRLYTATAGKSGTAK